MVSGGDLAVETATGAEPPAVIPLAHAGTIYGILDVHAGRPPAFGDTGRAVLPELGDTIVDATDAVVTVAGLREEGYAHRSPAIT